MCGTVSEPIIRAVEDDAVDIRLELRLVGDTLTGRAIDGDGHARDFTGRLGLLAAIDAVLAGENPSPGSG